jgi:four helix bundle protein
MRDTLTVPTPGSHALPDGAEPWLSIDRLDVYRLAVEFLSIATRLSPSRGSSDLRDQLERVSSSIVLNIAEGTGRASNADRARFFAIARGSATECAAVLDVLRARQLAPAGDCASARALLVRIVQMLSKLIARQTG